MKKSLLHLSLAAAAVAFAMTSAHASAHWSLQGKDYTVDTVAHLKVGPGTTHTSLSLTGGSNLKIFYVTTDLTNPYVDIRVAQAGSKLTGGAKLSGMSNANSNASTGIEYFAGVNADFFGGSQPIGASVVNGEVYKAPGTDGWVSFYMNDSKVPGVEILPFTGTATSGSASHPVTGINMGRGTDNLIIYNSHFAANTGTNSYGTEVVIRCDKTIGYNGTYECTVAANPTGGAGSMTIPADAYVLSGHGTASTFVAGLKEGDKVTLNLNTPLATGGTVTQMAGGQPIILKDGVTLDTQNALDHLTALNPRTAVGYSADRKSLVLLVVDGRSMGGSAGVVSKVLADIMRYVGCSDAMNFDGGGSSELYTRPFGVMNKPSDGTERTVVNSVWAVSTAPVDNEVAEIVFSHPVMSLPKYSYYTPTIYAYNKYGVVISTDLKGYTLSCPEELGEIVNDGSELYVNGSGTHQLTATYNGVSATMTVNLGTAQPRTRLKTALLDGYRTYKTEIVTEVDGKDMAVDNSAFVWTVDNDAVATVDNQGVIKGIQNGKAIVTATVDNFSASLPVTVEKPETRYIDLINGDISGWTASKSGLSAVTLSSEGSGFALEGKISSTRNTYMAVKSDEPILLYSLPDSIRIVMNPGNVAVNKVEVLMQPANAQGSRISKSVTIAKNTTGVVTLPISDLIDTSDLSSYPLTLSQLFFYLTGAVNDEFHSTLPTVAAVYQSVSGNAGVDFIAADHDSDNRAIILSGNIVAAGENVTLAQPTRWAVYSMSGALRAIGNGENVITSGLAAGNYIVATPLGSARIVIR